MFVGRGATTKQPERFAAGVPQLVPLAGRNGDGVPCPDFVRLAGDADFSRAVRDEINFLGARVKMFLRAPPTGNRASARLWLRMAELRCASSSRISEPSLVMNGGTSFRFFISID